MLPRLHTSRRAAAGFTLIELLTVLAIVGILAAILLPVLAHARASAKDSRCVGNLRQIGMAIQAYVTDHRGTLPPTGFFGISSHYNRDARNFQNSLLGYLDLKEATTWSTDPTQNSHSAVFECPAYKGNTGGKGYGLHDSQTKDDPAKDIADNIVRPWGYIIDPNGKNIAPAPQKLANMPPSSWAIRDASATDSNHPGHFNALYFDWHIGRIDI